MPDLKTDIPAGEYVPTADQRIVMHGVPWSHFEVMLAIRGDASVPRMAYLDGALELMSPSRDHERIKSYIGRLVEAFSLETDLDLSPYGAWMLKKAVMETGAEPDECYIIGSDQSQDKPDLVIEVEWTHGGLNKLEIYRRLGIPEFWRWKDEQIEIFVLTDDGFERRDSSTVLPDLDVSSLVSYLDRPTVIQAVKAYRETLRS